MTRCFHANAAATRQCCDGKAARYHRNLACINQGKDTWVTSWVQPGTTGKWFQRYRYPCCTFRSPADMTTKEQTPGIVKLANAKLTHGYSVLIGAIPTQRLVSSWEATAKRDGHCRRSFFRWFIFIQPSVSRETINYTLPLPAR